MEDVKVTYSVKKAFKESVRDLAKAFGISQGHIVQSLFLKWYAEQEAITRVFGDQVRHFYLEFSCEPSEHLLNLLTNYFVDSFKTQKGFRKQAAIDKDKARRLMKAGKSTEHIPPEIIDEVIAEEREYSKNK